MAETRARLLTKEDFLTRAAAIQKEIRQQNPDQPDVDLKLSTGWYEPVVQFSGVLQETVSQDVNDKLATVTREFAAASYSREALDKFAIKYRALLAGYPEALRLFDDRYRCEGPFRVGSVLRACLGEQGEGVTAGRT